MPNLRMVVAAVLSSVRLDLFTILAVIFVIAFAPSSSLCGKHGRDHVKPPFAFQGQFNSPTRTETGTVVGLNEERAAAEMESDIHDRLKEISPYSAQEQLESFRQVSQFKTWPAGKNGNRSISSASSWNLIGPSGMSSTPQSPVIYSGRVNHLYYSYLHDMYICAAHGGLWGPRRGQTGLHPLSDKLPTLATSSVTVHPVDTDSMWLATGDYNGGGWSLGIYRTYDEGATWNTLPLPLTGNYTISKIMMGTWNDHLLIASGSFGIIRSTDFGDSWTQVLSGKNISDFDAAFNGSVMLAGAWNDGLYRSLDSGKTWSRITLPSDASSSYIRGRISLGIALSNYGTAYVCVGRDGNGQLIGIYKTTNLNISGTPTWTDISPSSPLNGFMWGQQWYGNTLAVSQSDYNTVYVGGGSILRTTNGGSGWTELDWHTVHCDMHSLTAATGNKVLAGSDGGVFVSTNGGNTWSMDDNLQLPITEFYNISIDTRDHNVVYGAAQDNGISRTLTGSSRWDAMSGCDGFDVQVDQARPAILLNVDGLSVKRHRSTDFGATWSQIDAGIGRTDVIPAIAFSPISDGVLFTNSNTAALYSTNSGSSWNAFSTPPAIGTISRVCLNFGGSEAFILANSGSLIAFQGSSSSATTPSTWTLITTAGGLRTDKRVRLVCPSANSVTRDYALMASIDGDRIYRTTNSGTDWSNITGDLPNVQVNTLLESPFNQQTLYIGTELGAFKTSDGGTTWFRWNDGLPEAVRVSDLEYAYDSEGGHVIAGTFGRSSFIRNPDASDVRIILSRLCINFGIIAHRTLYADSLVLHNPSSTLSLNLISATTQSAALSVKPAGSQLAPGNSMVIHFTLTPEQVKGSAYQDEVNIITLFDDPNALPDTAVIPVFADIKDSTMYRTFIPESLVVKAPVKKTTLGTWSFVINSGDHGKDTTGPAPVSVILTFTSPVKQIIDAYPFYVFTMADKKGLQWRLSGKGTQFGITFTVSGISKKLGLQSVSRALWIAENGDTLMNDTFGPEEASNEKECAMPNGANVRQEVLKHYGTKNPMLVGVADPNAKKLSVAYVSLANDGGFLASIALGKSGKGHFGPARCFDFYENLKKISGKLTTLPATKQNNHLFAQLATLHLNITASALGLTPVGLGELRYTDYASPLGGMLVRDIALNADTFMTYCDSKKLTDGPDFDTVITKINAAFCGPIDTISFAKTLRLTGVRPVAETGFLVNDPSVMPARMAPVAADGTVPAAYALDQNYPNPFNPVTHFSFRIAEAGYITLKVYNLLGQDVATVVNEMRQPGAYDVVFNAANFASGVYFYRLSAQPLQREDGTRSAGFVDVKKMIVVK